MVFFQGGLLLETLLNCLDEVLRRIWRLGAKTAIVKVFSHTSDRSLGNCGYQFRKLYEEK